MLRDMLNDLLYRLRVLFRRKELDQELDEELLFHLEQQVEKNLSAGMSPEEARHAARRSFGNVTSLKEQTRDAWGIAFLETLWQDLRFALRSFRRTRGFTATVLVTLAIAVGIGTAIFAVVNGVLLRPLPYREPDRLVGMWRLEEGTSENSGNQPTLGISQPDFLDWREQSGLFESAVTINPNRAKFEELRRFLPGGYVDRDFCEMFGVQPALGRCFAPDDFEASAPVAIILQHNAWKSFFRSDPDIVGRVYRVEGQLVHVIGVMPQGFFLRSRDMSWWMPLKMPRLRDEARSQFYFWGVGRLNAGLTLKEAQARGDIFSRHLAERFPNMNGGRRFILKPLSEEAVAGLRDPLLLLLLSAGLVLLTVCSNVAGLVLVRALTRSTEFAVRSAVGAGRARLIRQVVTENAVLSISGGLLGLGLAAILVEYLHRWLPGQTVWSSFFLRADTIAIDPWVIGFAIGLSLLVGILFGLLPAFRGTSLRLATWIRGNSTLGSLKVPRAGHWLCVAQVSLAVVLAVAACLLLRSFLVLHQRGPGFRPDGVIGLTVFAGDQGRKGPTENSRWWNSVREGIATIPGVSAVTSSFGGLVGTGGRQTVWPERPESDRVEPFIVIDEMVDVDFFQVMEIPLIDGRVFDHRDERGAARVVVVSKEAARLLWPGENPLGKTLRHSEKEDAPYARTATVVGVAGDVRASGLQRGPEPIVYEALAQIGYNAAYWLVRSDRDPDSLFPEIVGRLRAIDPGVTIEAPGYEVLEDVVRDSTWQLNYTMVLLVGLAGLALLISAVGVYGVLSYTLRQRTREIGLRMALGADRPQVVRMFLRQGLTISVFGVAIGLVGAAGLTRFLTSLIYGVEPLDGLTFAIVAAVMLAAALLASYLPAAKAARVDPTAALRCE